MGQAQLLHLPLAQRLVRCRKQISQWKRTNICNFRENINFLRGRLNQAIIRNSAMLHERRKIKEDLDQAYIEEEVFWQQKSRVQWLR